MGDTSPGGDLNTFIEAGQAAVRAAQTIAQRHGDRMVFVGWVGTDGTSGFGGPDSPRWIAEDEETSAHLVQLARCIANQVAVTLLRTLLSGEQPRERLASIAAVDPAALQIVLNQLHEANLIFQPEPDRYSLTSNGEHAVGMLFWAALQVRRPLPGLLNQGRWFDA